jgi:hypothetical protein
MTLKMTPRFPKFVALDGVLFQHLHNRNGEDVTLKYGNDSETKRAKFLEQLSNCQLHKKESAILLLLLLLFGDRD